LKKIIVSNLPSEASEESVSQLFSEFGTVRSVYVASDVFTGRCRGFGSVEMEGHEARAAIAGLNGKMIEGKLLKVRFDDGRGKGKKRR